MDSDKGTWRLRTPTFCTVLLAASAFASGWLYCKGQTALASVLAAIAIVAATASFRKIRNLGHKLHFVIDATLNNDFSYKFPERDIPHSERETNRTLNKIVTHLEELTAATRRQEKFLAIVINMVDTGIIVADSAGNVRHANRAALEILDRPVLTNMCQIPENVLAQLTTMRRETHLGGAPLSIITIADLSRTVQQTETESWEKLIRVLTHEIMNSLTPIASISEQLAAEVSDSDDAEPLLTICRSSRSLINFVTGFRRFAALPEPKPEAFQIRELIERTIRLANALPAASDITLAHSCDPPDIFVYTDYGMLQQALLNLIKNGIEAADGHVEVTAALGSDESIRITVTDDGPGVPADIAAQIFTPFFTTRPGGCGIGLSLSRRIVNRLGGTLTLTGGHPTQFIICLH